MATRTLAQLITGTRQLANVETSTFVTDPELTDRVNEAVGELYDLVVSVYEHYFESAFSFSLAGGQAGNSQSLSALTGGFYKDNTLEKNPATSNMRIVGRLGAHANRDSSSGISYEIIGTPAILYVYPPEMSKGDYRLLFTPDCPVLAGPAPGPQVDLDASLSKWYQYVQIRAAIGVHRKRQKTAEAAELAGDEANPQPGTLAHERRRILTMAHNRQEGPMQVPIGRRRSNFFDYDDMP